MRRGFTLIELLVVIAIIAILAAILFPVFAKAREKARQTSCLSNLKQLALASLMYAQDYDEMMPGQYGTEGDPTPWSNWDDPVNCPGGWRIKILPYIKNAQIYQCPSVPSGPGLSGYLLNGYCSMRALAQFQSPSNVILFWELTAPQTWSRKYPNNTGGAAPNQLDLLDMRKWADHVHNGGDNNAFADGHAKWLGTYTNVEFDENLVGE
jgi:prepilin-type N-terminal cleavage/methylation domain-containing protein